MNLSPENVKRVDWQGTLAFVLLTLVLTWPAEIMAYLRGARFDAGSVGSDQTAEFLLIAVTVIPAFAAWIVRATATKEGFASAGLRFGPWQYYALTWIAIPWIYVVVYALSAAFGLGHFDPTFSVVASRLAQSGGATAAGVQTYLTLTLGLSLSVYILPALIPAFGAQFGWTGFVLPKLLPLGIWPATIGYGLLWGIWQLPLAAAGYIYGGRPAGFVLIILFTCSLAMIEAALRIRADSIFLSMFFEAAFSTQARGVAPLLVFVTQPLLGGIAGLTGIVVLAAIGAWLIATTPQAAVDAILEQQREGPAKTRAKRIARSRSS
jgi:hypothetical protein